MNLLELMQKCDYITDSGSLDVEIKDVIYDSRKVVPGCVFVALKGYNVDGHKFIPDAVERGAKALVVEDKGIAYDDLGPELREHVKLLVLTGMTAGKIRAAAEQVPGWDNTNPEILDVEEFDDAIRAAAARASRGDIVILSPASTSFDRFRNFEERGLRFQSVVNSL